MSGSEIRRERRGDEAAIAALAEAAFRQALHTDGTESALPGRLRDAGDLTLSLVAQADGELVGHVAFSPVTISDGSMDWYGLGPVSVVPAHQCRGIGSALIGEGLAGLEALGAAGCVVLGEPAYYGRFGFMNDPDLVYPGPPAKYFQRLVLRGDSPRGEVSYAAAFG